MVGASIEICRKKNIKVINSDISKFKGENRRFDVITLWQVLEHLNNPVPVMKKINNRKDERMNL